jgi:hypothetical protein
MKKHIDVRIYYGSSIGRGVFYAFVIQILRHITESNGVLQARVLRFGDEDSAGKLPEKVIKNRP